MRHRNRFILPTLVILVVATLQLACNTDPKANNQDSPEPPAGAIVSGNISEDDALHKANPNGSYGAGLSLETETELARILENPAAFEGQLVRVRGIVKDVCPMRGCWIDLADASGSDNIRVKVTDGEIVFPLSAKNATAVVEGTVQRIELDEQENRNWQQHLAEERGETFDPESIQGPATLWRIVGIGAEISN